MAGVKRSKRVSWAPGVQLCQVRLFLSEDAPSQSGFGTQDLLQAKPSWLLHATGVSSDDSPPPGFEVPCPAYQLKQQILQIPLIKWQCPPEIVLNPEWLVVAGEESEEVALENQRQQGVLEAIYPHPSLTPRNPSDSLDARYSQHDDLHTPVIPILAIEDEDEFDTSSSTSPSEQLQQPSRTVEEEAHCNLIPESRTVEEAYCNLIPDSSCNAKPSAAPELCAEPDIVAAASAAFTAIMMSNEEGSLIDRDLLIEILNNPALIEKLVAEYGAPKQPQSAVAPLSAPPPLIPPSLPPAQINLSAPMCTSAPTTPPPLIPPSPPPAQINLSAPMCTPAPTHIYPRPTGITQATVNRLSSPIHDVQIASKPIAKVPPAKDANYYKSLIQQHGEQRQEALYLKTLKSRNHHDYRIVNVVNNEEVVSRKNMEADGLGFKQRDITPKAPKQCAYFNTAKGCRYGASCTFQHAESFQQCPEQRKAKRMKLDREIMGRN